MIHFINGLVPRLKNQLLVTVDFSFSLTCLYVTGHICISKRVINFHPSISIKANGITSHYSGQPRTVTSLYKYAAPKKHQKDNPF